MSYITIISILCISLLTGLALSNDINGPLFTIALTLIAGLGGFNIWKNRTPK